MVSPKTGCSALNLVALLEPGPNGKENLKMGREKNKFQGHDLIWILPPGWGSCGDRRACNNSFWGSGLTIAHTIRKKVFDYLQSIAAFSLLGHRKGTF